ncbi:MAG: DNA repair protein RecO [Planctomycetota bacterium]
MSLEHTQAIVIRAFPWSETSVIATLFTRDVGKISVLAKGARRPKSPFEAALDLLSICNVVFIGKSSDSLDVLTEAKLQKRFRAGAQSLLRLYAGYYIAELVDKMTDKNDRLPEVFALAKSSLASLEDSKCDPRAIVLRCELQLLRMLGHLPSFSQCVQCSRPVGLAAEDNEGWVLFSTWSGGMVCDGCRASAKQITRLSNSVQELFINFSQTDWQSIALDWYPREHRTVTRKVIARYLMFILDRQFNLHPYLEELGR